MRNLYLACAILAALMLCGCDTQYWINRFTPQPEAKIGQQFIDDIRVGNFGPVRRAMDPQWASQIDTALPRIKSLFPPGTPKNVKVVSANTIHGDGFITYAIGYEYQFPNDWFYGEILLQRKGANLSIEGLHVNQMQRSLEEANDFSFNDKSALHYIFFSIALFVPVFTLISAIACWRFPIPRRKWFWRVFVLFGFVGFTMNWTTGAINIQLIQFLLLGAGFKKTFYGPVLLQIGIPIGALLFWWRRRSWLSKAEAPTGPIEG